MTTTVSFNLNKYQIAILGLYAANEHNQIYERQQQGDFDPDNLESMADALLSYGTTEPDEADAWIEDLLAKLQYQLLQASEEPQPFELELEPQQIDLLRNFVLYAQDNLRDQRGSEWDIMTDEATKLQQYGTTVYVEAIALIDAIDQQLPVDPVFGIPGSILNPAIDRLEGFTAAMRKLLEEVPYSKFYEVEDRLKQGEAAIQMLKNITTPEEEPSNGSEPEDE